MIQKKKEESGKKAEGEKARPSRTWGVGCKRALSCSAISLDFPSNRINCATNSRRGRKGGQRWNTLRGQGRRYEVERGSPFVFQLSVVKDIDDFYKWTPIAAEDWWTNPGKKQRSPRCSFNWSPTTPHDRGRIRFVANEKWGKKCRIERRIKGAKKARRKKIGKCVHRLLFCQRKGAIFARPDIISPRSNCY